MASGPEGRRRKTDPQIGRFATLFSEHEEWLMGRALRYAKERGYTRYTSTLKEAWRVSIAGLTESLIAIVEARGWDLELEVDEQIGDDPAMAFGIIEARRHRSRGVTLAMYLGLTKYYRQSYLDLVEESGLTAADKARHAAAVARFFDRVEIGFCSEWATQGEPERVVELQEANRRMTNEKNKYLTVFESIKAPALLLDADGQIDTVNDAASKAFSLAGASGASYYSRESTGERFRPLDEEIAGFIAKSAREASLERSLETADGRRHFLVDFKRMLDVSGKFGGVTVVLSDITERKEAEEAFRSLSVRDDLTGLYNRRGFEALGRQVFSMSRRLERGVAMVYLDLDDLKAINDSLGHTQGDAALREMGSLLAETFRESDVVGRLGGDEFGVLMSTGDGDQVVDGVERLKARLARRGKKRGDRVLEFSAGVAVCPDPSVCEFTDLVAEADANMYREKRARRSRREKRK